MILAGDVGGTKTRLALYESNGKVLTRRAIDQYPSGSSASLGYIVKRFLADKPGAIEAACFGIPGPVVNGTVRTVNLPWMLSEHELEVELKIPRVVLVNDLAATAAAIPQLQPDDLIVLQTGQGAREDDVMAVLAPGTGTGQGYLIKHGEDYQALASEGGHVNFAPTDELQDALLQYLRKRLNGRVSIERVLSGPGLQNIFEFLHQTGRYHVPEELTARMRNASATAVIAESGLAKEFTICEATLTIFASVLGAYAGDIALSYLATGGVYLGGGVPPRIAAKLAEGETVKNFLNKGRLRPVLESTPLFIIKDDHAAVLGAASIALQALKK